MRILTGLVTSLLVLGLTTPGPAAPVFTTTDVQTVPLHAVTGVRTLPPPAVDVPRGHGPRKPLLFPGGDAIRRWKDLLQRGRLRPRGHGRIAIDTAPPGGGPAPLVGTVTGQFEGLANADNDAVYGTALGILPPDNNLGVGPDHVFQIVNIVGRTSDKTGAAARTFDLNSFFGLDFLYSESDPKVIYDAASGRWFATYLEFVDFAPTFSDSSIMLAVSQTSDPTGTFCVYKLGNPTSETFLQDFPQLGVSDDKVVVSYNGFQFPLTVEVFLGAGYYVLNKADLTACAPLRATRVAPDPSFNTLEPSQNLSAGSDAFLVSHTGSGSATLTLLTVSGVPGVTPVTLTQAALPINAWTAAPGAEQAGSGVLIETNDERVITAAWQNGALWLGGNEQCTPSADTAARACLRVIEVDTGGPGVLQDITYGTPGAHYYYPALRPDGADNLHVVFSASSTADFPGVRVTGRLASDAPGTLQPSTPLRAGGGAQTDPSGRWGDFQGAAVDPSDPSSVWVHGEYVRSTAASDWGTFVARLQVPGAPTLIDLAVTAVTNPPVAAFTGDAFIVTDTTASGPAADAPASTTRYYLSTDTAKSAGDVLLLGARAVPALAAGTASSGSTTVTIPGATAPGSYYLLACADDIGAITESDETNNCGASATTVQVSPPPPDLIVSGLDDPPATALSGASTRVTDITQNVGTVAAPASTTRYYLSLDTVRDPSDVLLAGSRAVPALAAGASSTATVTVTIPSGTPAGSYFLLACADDLGVVTETSETNNCRASVHTLQLSLPTADLAVTAVSSPPAAAVPGATFVVTDTTQNVGPVVVGASTTGYVLSLDTIRSPDDIVIGSRGMGTLGSGVPSSGSAPATIPLNTPFATYYLLACADDTNQIVEANEANNCRVAAGTVVVAPPTADLQVTALSAPPAIAAATSSFAVTDTTVNAGVTGSAPATTTRYYLSTDTLRDGADILLAGARAVPSLVAGAASSGTVTVTVPGTTPVGVYFLLACADDTAQVPETNESNNCRASATTVQVTPASADLAVTGLDDPPASALSGGTFRATDITRNVGVVTAGASTTRYYLSLDTVRDAADVLLGGTRAIPSLAPNAFSTATVTVTVPSGTPAGSYFLLACADDFNVVPESNEANNCRASVHTTQVSLPTADLAVTAVSDPPAAMVPGTSFVVTDTTQNVGPITVGATTTRYVLSLDAVRSADDIVIGSRGLGALGSGVPSTGSAPATIPVGTPFATYFLLACADDTQQIVEANEANNCRAATGTVVVGPPTADLVVSAVSDPPVTAAASSSFAVTDTTLNAGVSGSASGSSTRYYLSLNTVRDAGDVLLAGARAVPSLVAGAASSGTVTVTIPTSTAVGTYFVLACADDTAQVPETNEANNCLASVATIQVTPATADLTVTGLDDPSASTLSGGTFRVTDITQNVGAVTAAPSTTRYYLSLDTVRDAADVLLGGTRAIPSLGPGASSTATVTVTIPSGTPAGAYFLLACADDLGVVTESNETNNCRASVHTTQLALPTADLAVTAVSDPPVTAAPGASFVVTDTTQNVGPIVVAASTTRYVLSLDGTRSADDIVIGSRGLGALGSGVPSTGSAPATIPAATPAATYFLLACADDTQQLVEANEANNCLAAAGTITVGP
jgi:subtilase family serine protease